MVCYVSLSGEGCTVLSLLKWSKTITISFFFSLKIQKQINIFHSPLVMFSLLENKQVALTKIFPLCIRDWGPAHRSQKK